MCKHKKITKINYPLIVYTGLLLICSKSCTKVPLRQNKMQQMQVVIGNKGGIPNVGNTCYLNSALQIIAKLYPHAFENKNDALARAGQKIVKKIRYDQKNATREETNAFYTPLLTAAKADGKSFGQAAGAQEDTQEAFLYLFEKYIFDTQNYIRKREENEDENEYYEKYYVEQVKRYSYLEKYYKDTKENSEFPPDTRYEPVGPFEIATEKDTTSVSMQKLLYEGKLQSELIREYKWHEIASTRTDSLKKQYPSYDVEPNSNRTKLLVYGSANLEKKLGNLKKLPYDTLPILFKRYGFDYATESSFKLHTTIEEPFRLTIDAKNTVENEDLKYNLVGFILQPYGDTSGGHYVAYIKSNGVWKQYNDSTVTLDAELEAGEKVKNIAGQAYFYFYKRVS